MVDLDGPPVRPVLITHSPERVSLTGDGPVHSLCRSVAEIRNGVLRAASLQELPHRTHIVVLTSVIVHVPDEETIVGIPAFRLGMEHVVLDIGIYPVALHIRIVRIGVVAGVSHDLIALRPESLFEGI